MAQLRLVNGDFQFRVAYSGQGMQKSDSFVFRVTTSGIKVMGMLRGVVLDTLIFEFDDKEILESVFSQKVMRVELVQDDADVVCFLAINVRHI